MHQTLNPKPQTVGKSPLRSLPYGETLRHLGALVGQRLLFSLVVLVAITYLTHLTFNAVAATTQGQPFWPVLWHSVTQTGAYLGQLLGGDLGVSLPRTISIGRPLPVIEALPIVVPRSLGLLGVTFFLSIAIGVSLGVWAAVRRHSRISLLVLILSFIGISTPSFFAALFLQIAAIQYTRTVGHSLLPVGGFGWDAHLILPMLVLAARPIAQITRVTFVALSDVLEKDYVRVAHGKGLRPSSILLIHALRNAAVPILTTVAVSLRFSLSSLPVIEIYFGWGGMGETLLRAMFLRDTNMTTALLLILGLLFIAVNLLLEISYAFIDPRLRETPTYADHNERLNLIGALRSMATDLHRFLLYNPISEWIRLRLTPEPEIEPGPLQAILKKGDQPIKMEDETKNAQISRQIRWGTWRQGTLHNPPLLLGGAIVLFLIGLLLLGPQLAPYSPNTTQNIAVIDGVLTTPPFPPDEIHPWGTDPLGRDILSLVLAGAQQTLILVFAVVSIRLIIGFVLGVLAGWFHESWLDRLITGLVQVIMVFPTLLLAALLIFAFDVQDGMRPFLLGLSLVGWGEIMQLVRGEVIKIRPQPFIESAVAVGQRTSRLILIHVLPNLAPALIAVAAVEVGAVLLILGELGFIGIFISGGAGSDFGLYAQVPEWGSLLSNVRNWTRSFPWTGFYPMAAFFVAILGFNLLSEGLRRLIEAVGLVINRLFNRYTLAFMGLAVVGLFWMRTNTGELAFYRQQAEAFVGENAVAHMETLVDPALDGRALGSEGLQQTADYIADEFKQLGLQAGGENLTFFQNDTRAYQFLETEPRLRIHDGGDDPHYRDDYTVFPKASINAGDAQGPVRLVVLAPDTPLTNFDFSQDILLLLHQEDLPRLQTLSCRGVLIIARDLSEMKRRYTLAADPPGTGCGQETPILWVSDRLGNRLLSETGYTVTQLQDMADELEAEESLDMPTAVTAEIAIAPAVQEAVPVVNVIGHWPGTSDTLDANLIIIAAQYDAPPLGLEGVYPGANDNASGVAAMLETIRTLKESGYQPFKTFLFVAYSGEGLPASMPAPDVTSFLEARTGFASAFTIEAVIYVRGFASSGQEIGIWGEETSRLAKLMETASNLSGLETERLKGTPTMNIFIPGLEITSLESDFPQIGFSRRGWEGRSRLTGDSMTFISTQNLAETGRALSLGLMILGREQNY